MRKELTRSGKKRSLIGELVEELGGGRLNKVFFFFETGNICISNST